MDISYNAQAEIAFDRLNVFQFDTLYQVNVQQIILYEINDYIVENNYLYETMV